MMEKVIVIGAGLAGSEACWQLAQRGILVELHEMRPGKSTPAHKSAGLQLPPRQQRGERRRPAEGGDAPL